MDHNFNRDADINQNMVETAHKVADGKARTENLIQRVEERERQYQDMRHSFNVTVSRESDEVKQFCRDTIHGVDRCFEEYFRNLDDIKTHARHFDREKLVEAADSLEENYNNLYMAFLAFRNDAMIARGPTSHGGMNTIINSVKRIQLGEEIQEQLKSEVEMEFFLAEQALQALEVVEANFFNQRLQRFYEEYLEILKDFEGYFEENDGEMLQELLDRLEAEGNEYRTVDVYYQSRVLSSEPTRLPMVNLALNCAKGYVKEECPVELFEYYLSELEQLYGSVRYRYEHILKTAQPGNEFQAELVERIDMALEEMADCMEGLYEVLETGDEEVLEKIRESIEKSAEIIAEAVDNFKRMTEEGSKIKCFRCGFENSPGRISCSNCNALLPVVEQKEAEQSLVDTVVGSSVVSKVKSGPVMTQYVHELFETASGFLEGEATPEEYSMLLSEMESRYQKAGSALKEPPKITPEMEKEMGREKAEKALDTLKKAAAAYQKGLNDFAEGLALMRKLLDNPTSYILEKGREAILRGMENLQKSQKLIEEEFANK